MNAPERQELYVLEDGERACVNLFYAERVPANSSPVLK